MLHSSRRNREDPFSLERCSMPSVFCRLTRSKDENSLIKTRWPIRSVHENQTRCLRSSSAANGVTSIFIRVWSARKERTGEQNFVSIVVIWSCLSLRRSSPTTMKVRKNARRENIVGDATEQSLMRVHRMTKWRSTPLVPFNWLDSRRSWDFNRFFKSHEYSVSNSTTEEKDIHCLSNCTLC